MKKWLVVLGGLAAVAVLAGLAVVQRDTAGAIRTQHENELKSELQALNDFKTWHKAQQDKPDPTIARVFVSKGIIDGLLASFDGMVVPVPNDRGHEADCEGYSIGLQTRVPWPVTFSDG